MAARVLLLALCASCATGLDSGSANGTSDAGTTTPPTAEARAWLDAHNAVRQSVQPAPASPLPALTWSDAATQVAQAWADGCVYQHNQNRGERGENIAANAPPSSWSLQDVVSAWASEATDYDYARNACAAGKVCGHYTQLVWRDTTRVGCAHRTCTGNSPFGSGSWEFWVCDYEPPGNWLGQKPY
jgi:pathogenesis-related protein 1